MAFWQFAFKNFTLSMGELYRDLNKSAFLRSGQKFIPCLSDEMVEPSFSGIMSQVFEVGIYSTLIALKTHMLMLGCGGYPVY